MIINRTADATIIEPKKIILNFHQSPGDTLAATTSVECLARLYGPYYKIKVSGTDAKEIFANNPHIEQNEDISGYERITMHNPFIHRCDKIPVHFIESYIKNLSMQLNIPLLDKFFSLDKDKYDKLDGVGKQNSDKLFNDRGSLNRPYIYMSEEEKNSPSPIEEVTGGPLKYWLICSGVKNDYTIKTWGHKNYQEVVKLLKGKVQFVQVGRVEHGHLQLEDAIDFRGKTQDTRKAINLSYHSQGGIGGESFFNHLFGALQKPFVCIASGFLPKNWFEYPTSIILHKAQFLSCCNKNKGACWRSRVVKLNDKDGKDFSLCDKPVNIATEESPEFIAKCMAMITPEEVAQAVLNYYEGGVLV